MALTHADYTVAWICALPLEMAATKSMIDTTHPALPQPKTDHNSYTLGSINGHNVVVACLPYGVYGKISASTVVSQVLSTFPNIQFGLMVGIGGGVPSTHNDIRLGDVVVSKPTSTSSGVIQYDYGKSVGDGRFQRTGSLNKPPQVLLAAMAQVESDYVMGKKPVSLVIKDALQEHSEIQRPREDWLFQATYSHQGNKTDCSKCRYRKRVRRPPRTSNDAHIHYGLIASGDQVIKDAVTRDKIAQNLDILCFEMEAAGLMDQLPSLVIRGICDYCDSHKNKQWQLYAALAAAAYAKVLLSFVPVTHRTEDRTLSNKPHWLVPFKKNARFVGREDEIAQVEALMAKGPGNIAICGLGGVGKTQIALELAYRRRDRDPSCSIFWIPCTSKESAEQAYTSIAQILGIQAENTAHTGENVKAHLSQKMAGACLLIFDNADDMDMWIKTGNNPNPDLKGFLPPHLNGHILFTTRNRRLAVKLAAPNVIGITEPSKEIGLEILEKALVDSHHLLHDGGSAAMELLEQLAFLPLAIIQAAAYINENEISIAKYAELLQKQEDGVIEVLSEEFEDEGRYEAMQNPVATTWWVSFQQINDLDPLAGEYLKFIACISPRDILQTLLPPAATESRAIKAISLLKAYSFITTQVEDKYLSLHRLVHLATRNWMRQNQQFSQQILKTADHFEKIFPDDEGYYSAGQTPWRDHLQHVFVLMREDVFQKEAERYVGMIKRIGGFMYYEGRYLDAEELLMWVMEIQLGGSKNRVALSTIKHLGLIYRARALWDNAELMQTWAMEESKRALGPEHPTTLVCIIDLASTYQRTERWQQVDELLDMTFIRMCKRVLGPGNRSTIDATSTLAMVYKSRGRWDEAEELDLEAVRAGEQFLGPEHPQTLDSTLGLAFTYQHRQRWQEAMELSIRATDACRRELGPEHPSTLVKIGSLAYMYQLQGRWTEAESLYVRLVETVKRVLGLENPITLSTMIQLAHNWKLQGKNQEACTLMERCFRLQKQIFGPEHPETLMSSRDLHDWKKVDDS